MLVPHVEVQIVVSLEAKAAELANKRLLIEMSPQVTFEVWLCWETFAADVTIERLIITMETFVESP